GIDENALSVMVDASHGHARFGLAVADDLLHVRQVHERIHDRGGIVGADEDVDVADRLFASPHAAAQLHALDAGDLLQFGDDGLGDHHCLIETDTVAHFIEKRQALEDVLLCFFAETLEFGDRALITGFLEFDKIVDAELIAEGYHLLRTHAGQSQHLQPAWRRFGLEVVIERQLAGGDEYGY